jgi:hypothetical protein
MTLESHAIIGDNSGMGKSGVGPFLGHNARARKTDASSDKLVANKLDVAGRCSGFVSPTRL